MIEVKDEELMNYHLKFNCRIMFNCSPNIEMAVNNYYPWLYCYCYFSHTLINMFKTILL